MGADKEAKKSQAGYSMIFVSTFHEASRLRSTGAG